MDAQPYHLHVRNRAAGDLFNLSIFRLVTYVVLALCLLLLVDAVIPQLQLLLFRQIVVSNAIVKGALLTIVAIGSLFHPKLRFASLPIVAWSMCVCYLIADILHLVLSRGMTISDVVLSYNGYYSLLLLGPALLVFRDAIPERYIVGSLIAGFLVCTAFGVAQHFTGQPILYTNSPDGTFEVQSAIFFGEVRAFSLFTSAMNFGMFCALCGALAVALFRSMPVKSSLLFLTAALACYTTLTRLSYVVFGCACTYAMVITFGKKPARGRWQPLLYCVLGIATVIAGLYSFASGDTSNLQDTSSLMERLGQWAYYSNVISQSSLAEKIFGLGIVQMTKIVPRFPMVIDNVPLALILHVGLTGLVLFAILMFKMWIYIRRESLATEQPFLIAAASLWATLACAGIFNIVFSSFGIVFALCVLCEKKSLIAQAQMAKARISGVTPSLEP